MNSITLAHAFEQVREIVQHGPVTLNPHEVIEEVRRLKAAEQAPVNLVKAAARHFASEVSRTSAPSILTSLSQ